MIVYERCDDKNHDSEVFKCKSKEEIDKWLEFKYLIVLENSHKFVHQNLQQQPETSAY